MTDFLTKYQRNSKAMRKAWVKRRAKRAETTYNLSLTVTQRDTAPGTDVAVCLEIADMPKEEAQAVLQEIRALAREGQAALPSYTADLLGLSRANEKGIDKRA